MIISKENIRKLYKEKIFFHFNPMILIYLKNMLNVKTKCILFQQEGKKECFNLKLNYLKNNKDYYPNHP